MFKVLLFNSKCETFCFKNPKKMKVCNVKCGIYLYYFPNLTP